MSISSCLAQTGGLNSRDYKDCKLTIKAPVNCTASVVAVQDVCYTINGGALRRQE